MDRTRSRQYQYRYIPFDPKGHTLVVEPILSRGLQTSPWRVRVHRVRNNEIYLPSNVKRSVRSFNADGGKRRWAVLHEYGGPCSIK